MFSIDNIDNNNNGQTSSEGSEEIIWLGFLCCFISVLFFGSSFVPVKKFKSGDGFFYQWVMCSAIWIVGLITYGVRGCPKFEPLAMLGGALWCIGNACAIPIIQMIGMALGQSIWGISNLVMGWASGAFGILGVERQPANIPVFNYIGAAIAVLSVVLYALVGGSDSSAPKKEPQSAGGVYSRLASDDLSDDVNFTVQQWADEETFADLVNDVTRPRPAGGDGGEDDGGLFAAIKGMNPTVRRVCGIVLALVSGVFYGVNFNPPQYRIDHGPEGTSREVLDYVFPHFTGIFAMSTLIFLGYCMLCKNRPAVYREVVLPGFLSGIIWAIAQVSWFVANKNLSFTIAFPIITSGPSIVASLWGVAVFREFSGKVKYIKLIIAICTTLVGVVFITLSKVLKSL